MVDCWLECLSEKSLPLKMLPVCSERILAGGRSLSTKAIGFPTLASDFPK